MVLSRFPVVSAPAKQPEPQPVVLPSGVRCVVNFNTINKGQRFFATSIRGQELKKSLDWEFNPAGQFQFRLMGINGTSYNTIVQVFYLMVTTYAVMEVLLFRLEVFTVIPLLIHKKMIVI